MFNSNAYYKRQQQQSKVKLVIVTIHDACPAFSTKIFKVADLLEDLDIKYNIALIPFFHEKQDLTSYPDFVEKIKSYKDCEIALHGLYHERRSGKFDDFHTVTKSCAEEEIRTGLQIFQEIAIKPIAFIPPAWKLNDNSIEVLEKIGFNLTETQEKLLILSSKSCKKIKIPKVFNWDSTGYPEKNIINIAKDERRFKTIIEQEPPIIRIAIHPRDPYQAWHEQKSMISKLKDEEYTIQRYGEILSALKEYSYSSIV